MTLDTETRTSSSNRVTGQKPTKLTNTQRAHADSRHAQKFDQLHNTKGVAERGSRTKGWGGGPAKGRKKNCDLTDFDGGSGH